MAVTDITTKRCSKCGEHKQLTEFYKSKRNGLKSDCKACAKIALAKWRAANQDKARAASAAWQAANPDKAKASSAKWLAKNRDRAREATRKWEEANRDRKRETDAAWYAANHAKALAVRALWRERNPEKCKALASAWQKENLELKRLYSHNRRAKQKISGGKLSSGLADRLFNLQRGKCACCGKPLGDDFHLDHIMPLALGGANTDDNIQLLRSKCNQQKNAKHPVDFMRQRGFLL